MTPGLLYGSTIFVYEPLKYTGMENRQIIEIITKAFNDNDDETILKYMADDVEWHILGDDVISGKENVGHFFSMNPEIKMITCTQDHFLIDGDVASVSGEVQCQNRDGKVFDMYYCDIYELLDSKVKKMITYGVKKPTDVEGK
jgi:ketosteroid isomerase-like protein